MTEWHVGRGWSGHPIEDGCPCPKAPCGLVIQEKAICPQHGPGKTLRQGHLSRDCYGDTIELCPTCGTADSEFCSNMFHIRDRIESVVIENGVAKYTVRADDK